LNRTRWIVVAVVVVGALTLGWWRMRGPGDAPRFRTAAVERGAIESVVSATGTVLPVVQVEVGSQVSGTVAELFADYNSRVRRGQVLCQLEPSSFRARAVQAEAAVSRAEAALLDARRGYRRAQELVGQNYISQADVDAAEVAVKQREADLAQARAALEVARVDLANTTIRAPIDGVVIARSIDLGQTVAASLQAPKLFVIANDLAQMQVETRIDEADVGVIRPGLPATFTVDAFPDFTFEGEVEQVRLEPIVEQGVVTYTTVIRTRNPGERLRPGMTANVTVRVARREAVAKVPNAALRFRPPVDPKARPAGGALADERPGAGVRTGAGPGGGGPRPGRSMAEGGTPARRGGAEARGLRGAGGAAGRAGRGPAGARGAARDDGALEAPAYKPGAVYVLRGGEPARIAVLTGLTDGAFTEVRGDSLRPGDLVVVGLETPAGRGQNLTPPPGMGGPQFGPGRGRPGGGRR
jgi:HlyD family secretion protein